MLQTFDTGALITADSVTDVDVNLEGIVQSYDQEWGQLDNYCVLFCFIHPKLRWRHMAFVKVLGYGRF